MAPKAPRIQPKAGSRPAGTAGWDGGERRRGEERRRKEGEREKKREGKKEEKGKRKKVDSGLESVDMLVK